MVQWLGLHASNVGGTGSIPGRGTRIPHAHSAAKKLKNLKINKNLKNKKIQLKHRNSEKLEVQDRKRYMH